MCSGLVKAAQTYRLSHQRGRSKEAAWEAIQKLIDLTPDSPWPLEPEREALLERAYVETVESTRSGRLEQVVFFSAHEYEACVR